MLKKDEEKSIKFAKRELANLSFSLTKTEKKLDKLLEGYLEELVDSANYQQKKKELLGVKTLIQEKIALVRKKGTYWVEPMRTFIKEAVATAKIAHENNNCSLLSQRAKKVGSNYLLEDKRISFLPNSPHDLLASSAFDASNLELTPELCGREDLNLHARNGHIVLNDACIPISALPHIKVQEYFTILHQNGQTCLPFTK